MNEVKHVAWRRGAQGYNKVFKINQDYKDKLCDFPYPEHRFNAGMTIQRITIGVKAANDAIRKMMNGGADE